MQAKAMYVNLPCRDLGKTKEFWTQLGFSFNEQFSDEKAVCLVLQEDTLYVMLISYDYFSTFTHRPIFDGSTTQVLNALQFDTREQVDQIVQKAFSLGGTRYRDGADHGWMYYDCFEDLDGHQWEIMHMAMPS